MTYSDAAKANEVRRAIIALIYVERKRKHSVRRGSTGGQIFFLLKKKVRVSVSHTCRVVVQFVFLEVLHAHSTDWTCSRGRRELL